MKLFFSIALFCFLVPFLSQAQVKVTTINDHIFYGFVLSDSQDTLRLLDKDRLNIIIPKKNIAFTSEVKCFIKMNNSPQYSGRVSAISTNGIMMDCDDGVIRTFDYARAEISFRGKNVSNYPFFGLTLGTPGGINLNVGKYFSDDFGISFTGGIAPVYDLMYGIQANILYSLSKEEHFNQNISIGIGYTYIDNYTYELSYYSGNYVYYGYRNYDKTSIGIFYDFNLYGIFIQPGVVLPISEAKSSPNFRLQLGYVYRLND